MSTYCQTVGSPTAPEVDNKLTFYSLLEPGSFQKRKSPAWLGCQSRTARGRPPPAEKLPPITATTNPCQEMQL
jgi:hypothetical protein